MGYYERKLPHWHPEGVLVFVTWRLHGSLPAFLKQDSAQTPGQAFRAVDRVLDCAGRGPAWLRDPRIAAMVVNALEAGDKERQYYRLAAFVAMPNHVHALLLPLAPMPRVTHWIKGYAARQANQILERPTGAFWQHESYDHRVRTEDEYSRIVRYIEFNPVSAGLVATPEEWPWSSAASRISFSLSRFYDGGTS